MATVTLLDSPIWKEFAEAARQRHKVPEDLVVAWIRELLEIWEDETLDNEIAAQARLSGLGEEDAVELVCSLRPQ